MVAGLIQGAMIERSFLWGASMAGFQFEMGDLAGRALDPNTDWFKWVHDPTNIQKKVVSGDLPEDGVNYWEFYESDHDLAKKLGMNAYRIGTEWSRVFPKSTSGVEVGVETASDGAISKVDIDQGELSELEGLANADALRHYESVIDDLRSKGFKVIVCLNHFTLPLWIHDPIAVRDSKLKRGPRGWHDSESVVEFAKYAAVLASRFGPKVDMWATFNEPMVVTEMAYLVPQSGFPPGLGNELGAMRKASANMAAAHAMAFDLIKQFDNHRADGNSESAAWVGLIHNIIPSEPADPSNDNDVEAAKFLNQMHNKFFMESAASGWLDLNFDGQRDEGEVKGYLGNRLDWVGLNYYSRNVMRGKSSILARLFAGLKVIPEMVPGYGFACKSRDVSLAGRPTSDFGWELFPEGFAKAILEVSKYGRPIYVTENGIADSVDDLRPRYLVEHLREMERLIDEGKADIRGYLHWALTDNYEWAQGFSKRFGLIEVDLKTKARKIRGSGETFRQIVDRGTTAGIRF